MAPVTAALVVLILTPLLYQLYLLLEWIYRIWFVIGKAANKFPGEPTNMFSGNLHQIPGFNEKQFSYVKNMSAKYNRGWRQWLGPFVPIVTLCHPETVKVLAKTEAPKFTEAVTGYVLAMPWLGEGLLSSSGQKWKRNRRLLTPAFHFDILKGYIDVFNDEAAILMGKWTKKCDSGSSFNIQTDVCLCTLNTILRCAFSYEENIQEAGEQHPYATAVLELSRLLMTRAFSIVARTSDFLYKLTANGQKFFGHCDYVHKVAEDIIARRRQSLKEEPHDLDNKKVLDFLDILLQARDENGVGLRDIEIRNEADTFLFEGHDTTASAISWALYSLAKHPECQKKAQEEIDDLLTGRPDKRLTWDDMSQLPFLTRCIKESLRLWSPVPNIARQIKGPLTIDGVTFPPHTFFIINILALHHNPTVWGADHDEYKPDRFRHENVADMDSFAFLPFSAGPRNCIGQIFALNEQKVMIARILERFSLSTDEEHPPIPRPEVVTRAINGIKLQMTPR